MSEPVSKQQAMEALDTLKLGRDIGIAERTVLEAFIAQSPDVGAEDDEEREPDEMTVELFKWLEKRDLAPDPGEEWYVSDVIANLEQHEQELCDAADKALCEARAAREFAQVEQARDHYKTLMEKYRSMVPTPPLDTVRATFPSFEVMKDHEPSPIKSPHSEGVFPKPDTVSVGRDLIREAIAGLAVYSGIATAETQARLQSALGDA